MININRQLEANLSDALVERPVRFRLGKREFGLYPPTLGKMQLLKDLYLAIDMDEEKLLRNAPAETLRVCARHPVEVCRIIAYSTLSRREDVMNSEQTYRLASWFRRRLSLPDMATVLSLLLTGGDTESFVRYFGLDAERELRRRISDLKGEGSSLTFGGKSLYGILIDFACQRYGWTMDYVLWGISYVNLSMLFADAITTVYLTDEERKQLGASAGRTINADDPRNRELVREMISETPG